VLAMTTPGHCRVKLDGKDRHHPEAQEGAGCHSYGSPSITGRPGHAGAVRWSRYCHSTLETPTSPVPSNCSANRGSRVIPGRAENDLRAGPRRGDAAVSHSAVFVATFLAAAVELTEMVIIVLRRHRPRVEAGLAWRRSGPGRPRGSSGE